MLRTRYLRILLFFGRAILDVILWDIVLSRLGLRSVARRNRPGRFRRLAKQFRILAVRMGGVMIKVGQFMSARLDVLPREITDELSGLQDEVSSEDFEDILAELETSLDAGLHECFTWFEETPMASASIGQAHRASIRVENEDGTSVEKRVVVKVQRPNIEKIVAIDLSALRIVSRWLNRYPPIYKHVNVPALLEELSRSIYEEMDYIHEGKNAERFAENFKDRSDVQVPSVFWETTTRKVITLQDVQAIKITDYASIEAAGIDRAEVADRLFDTYLKQILEDRFFHADPHPGNLFVEPLGEPGPGPRPWRLVFVDFGMTGDVPSNIMDGLREVIIAISTGDAPRLVRADDKLNFLLPSADRDLLERAYQRVFERFWGKSTRDMMKMHKEEAASFLGEFRELIYDMPFQCPEDMILLGRCLSILSGMCTGLYTDFNFWTSLGPYAQKLVQQEGSRDLQFWIQELIDWLSTAVNLPKRINSLIRHMEAGNLQVQVPGLNQKIARLERAQGRIAAAILFAAFLLAGVQLYLAEEMVLSYVAAGLAGVTLLFVLFKR
jgi:predicted unusual protein kinase regulating ubiquinone biosynthesis (AarF/ABC1/UbiB family)